MIGRSLSPVSRLFLLIILIAVAVVVTFSLATNQPSSDLGLRVAEQPMPDGGFRGTVDGRSVSIFGLIRQKPDRSARQFASPEAFADHTARHPTDSIMFEADDFIEEPDMLASFEANNRFMARQAIIHGLMQNEAMVVVYADGSAKALTSSIVPVAPQRQAGELGTDFWLQLSAACVMLLISTFLITLRPGNGPAAAFAASGVGAALAALTAAVYSTRDIALDPELFRALSIVNQAGTFLFGIGAIYLFAAYPVALVRWKRLWPVPILCLLLLVLYRLQALPFAVASSHNGIMGLLIGIVVLVIAQYRATRANPADRAVMLWLGVSVVIGAGSFVLFVTIPLALGMEVVISQGAAFVPLAAIYAATAVGVMRYRLFDLGRWAYRLLFYTGLIIGILAIDLAIAYALSLSPSKSLGLAALIAGFAYIVFRDLALRRLLAERQPELAALYQQTNAIAFRPTAAEKEDSWTRTIREHFQPVDSELLDNATEKTPHLVDEGLALTIPAYSWSRGMRLRLASNGRRLFDSRDLALVAQLADLVTSAEKNRLSYEQGVLEERRRIAMDLHDDVGATLLSGLHARSEGHRQEAIMDALSDIRQIASGLSGRDVILSQFIGHLRHETRSRAELHGFTLSWTLGSADDSDRILPYLIHRNFNAMHREALSNALKHGLRGEILVRTEEDGGTLVHEISNPAPSPDDIDPMRAGSRLGSGNIRQRAAQMNGGAETEWQEGRYRLRLVLPLTAAGEDI